MAYIKKKDIEDLRDMANYILEPRYDYFKIVLNNIVNKVEKERIRQNIKQKNYARKKRGK